MSVSTVRSERCQRWNLVLRITSGQLKSFYKAGQEGNKKLTVSFEELAFSNMLTINALVELLTEKGFLTQQASGGVP